MQFHSTFVRTSLILLFVTSVAGCSSGFDAVTGTVRSAADGVLPESLRSQKMAPEPKLDPRFRYLRATLGGHVAYFALGYENADAHGPVEVWYSGTGEVLKIQRGRLDGASGLLTEWRNVDLARAPTWQVAATSATPLVWTRLRDVMPGYRYGVEDRMTLKRIALPKKTALQRVDPSRLVWFEERTETIKGAEVPPAIYGVEVSGDKAEVVYSEQCVAVDFCFTLQRWAVDGDKTDRNRR